MKTGFAKIILVFIIVLFLSPSPSNSNPLDKICLFFEQVVEKDVDGFRKTWESMVEHWPLEAQTSVSGAVLAPLGSFSFSEFSIYRVLELPGIAEEYFVVVLIENNASAYMRLLFEKWDDSLKLRNLRFEDSYEKIAAVAFAQKPVPVDCT